jgi:hypothetical protein
MLPQAMGNRNAGISVRGEKAMSRSLASRPEAVHVFPDFDVDVVMVDQGRKFIFGHDRVRNDGAWLGFFAYSRILPWEFLSRNLSDRWS